MQQKEIQNTIKIDHAVHASYVAKQFLITHTMGDGKSQRKHFSGSTGKATLKVVVVLCVAHQIEANRIHQVRYKPKLKMKKTNYCMCLPFMYKLSGHCSIFASQSEILLLFFLQIQEEPVSSILLCSL